MSALDELIESCNDNESFIEMLKNWEGHRNLINDASAELVQLRAERDKAKHEIAEFWRTFAGHVYVPNDEFATLCKERREAIAEVNRLRENLSEV